MATASGYQVFDGTGRIDLAALMKVSQALSAEIVLNTLLVQVMMILMENAGAERGCLLLNRKGRLYLAAERGMESEEVLVLPAIPLDSDEGRSRVSEAIAHDVAQTQASLLLNPARSDSRFRTDPYLRQHQPEAIFCNPLLYQGNLSGIIYLENYTTATTFTRDRLEILQYLSTQAAISIDNAQRYTELEVRMQERTTELTQTNQHLQAEIQERQRSEQTLRLIVEGTASVTGEDFFRSLVRSLAQALDVRYAFITECVERSPTHVRSFAFWDSNKFGENFEYDVQGTPCELTICSKRYQLFPNRLQDTFPIDSSISEMNAQSYAGIPLLNSTGNLLGHLAVLDNKAMEEEDRYRAILEIFAARAAAEMERQQAQEALKMSEAKFSTAFRSSPDAITISTLNEGTYIEVNDSCLRMFGYSREEMLGRSALDLIWANAAERNAIKQQLHHRQSVSNIEVQFRRKSGERFPGLFSAEVIYLEDEPWVLAVATDITMLKQAEKALAQLAEIGELSAMIVHEVRNPVTTIAMGLNAFKRLPLVEPFQEYLALSLDETARLQRLLNQILLYARPQTLERSPIELNSLTRELLATLRTTPIAADKQLSLVAPNHPIWLSADQDKLKQVLINLLTNACEAVHTQDTITVTLEELSHQQVCIQIHNGGSPIPADILPKLTKPFFTTKATGTGLGLAIVRRIIEAHEGEFQIESSISQGTIVKVRLPAV